MSDFIPPERATPPRDRHGHAAAPTSESGGAADIKRKLRVTEGIEAQQALLTPPGPEGHPAPGAEPFEHTGRGRHAWRMALLGGRNDMIMAARMSLMERSKRDLAALDSFEGAMTFAKEESVLGLSIGKGFNKLLGALSGPIATVHGVIELASDIYTEASKSSRGARLDAWIEAHQDAAHRLSERRLDAQSEELRWVGAEIERLVADDSEAGERRKQEWERSMKQISFPVQETAEELEVHLYERWCVEAGAHVVVNLYRTDRHYPGHEEVGQADQETAYGGRQAAQVGVPDQIRGRLARLHRDPTKALDLPVEHRHHEREPGTGRWVGRGVTRFGPEEETR